MKSGFPAGRFRPGVWCILALVPVLFSGGCASYDVSIRKVEPVRRFEYSSSMMQFRDGLMSGSINVLGNFLLHNLYRESPDRLLEQLEKLYRKEPFDAYIETLADCSLNLGIRFQNDPEQAARYYLSAVLYSYAYISKLDRVESAYNPARLGMIRVYNLALTELLSYLSHKKLAVRSGFELRAAAGQVVFFEVPDFRLQVKKELIREFLLCADYRPVNLTHESRRFGIGVPLIATLAGKDAGAGEVFAENMVFPATAVLEFKDLDEMRSRRYQCRILFADPHNQAAIEIGGRKIPLELDLSTPLAYMAKDPPPFHFLFYMLRPEETGSMQGLYRFEAFDPNRIPVVLVHGLMSDTRTWLQMINTLRSDPAIRKKYQIYGFSYSSGNPVINSAAFMRRALTAERDRIVKAGLSTDKFDQMVLVGHSMGGLLSRLAVSESGNVFSDLFLRNGGTMEDTYLRASKFNMQKN